MASEILIVVGSDRACMNEIIDRGAINRAIMVPSIVQFNQHVRLSTVVTDGAHKAALGRFGACKRIEANWRVAIFDRDTFC
jgi:hypothetical protein